MEGGNFPQTLEKFISSFLLQIQRILSCAIRFRTPHLSYTHNSNGPGILRHSLGELRSSLKRDRRNEIVSGHYELSLLSQKVFKVALGPLIIIVV